MGEVGGDVGEHFLSEDQCCAPGFETDVVVCHGWFVDGEGGGGGGGDGEGAGLGGHSWEGLVCCSSRECSPEFHVILVLRFLL